MGIRVGNGTRLGLGTRVGRVVGVMPMGDSITLGASGDPGGWRKVFFDAHTHFKGRGANEDPAGYKHEGYSSYTILTLHSILTSQWALNPSRELWITAGTNDIYTGASAQTALDRMAAFLASAVALSSPPTTIRVASITPMLIGGLQTIIDAYNAGLPAVVAAVPKARFHDVGGRLSSAYLAGDNIHPTAAGHTLLAQYWAESLGLA